MALWIRLFLEFFKTGLFAVGGGLATLPFLYEMSASTGWFTAQDVADMIAISESTPGPLGVNMATYVGFKTLGFGGGFISTLGLVCPAIVIIILVCKILNKFKESSLVKKIFYGLRPASTALIAAAGIGVAKISLLKLDVFQETGAVLDLFNWKCIILAVVVYVTLKKYKKHPIVYIAVSAVIGIIFQL